MTKKIIGQVISDKMQKTRIVVTEILKQHPRYKKFYKHRTKYYVHDEKEKSKVGDWVIIKQVRPLSKLKRWVLVQIIDKNENKVVNLKDSDIKIEERKDKDVLDQESKIGNKSEVKL